MTMSWIFVTISSLTQFPVYWYCNYKCVALENNHTTPSPLQKGLEIQEEFMGGGGSLKGWKFKRKYEAKLVFSEGWGGGTMSYNIQINILLQFHTRSIWNNISLSDFLISRGQKVHVYCRRHAACDLPQVSVFFLLFSFFQYSTFLSFVNPTEVHIYCIITFVLRIMKKQSIGCMKPLQKKTGKI